MSDESIKPPEASNNSLAVALNHVETKLQVKFEGNFLKQDKVTFTYKQVLNIYVTYKVNSWSYTQGADFMLGNSLFGADKLIKNADPATNILTEDMVKDLMLAEFFIIRCQWVWHKYDNIWC